MRAVPGFVVLMAFCVLGLLFSGQAQAAVCADYANQADAQRAADTIDADGDGIYCEALPCPCLKPGQADTPKSPSPPTRPAKPTKPKKAKPKALTARAQIVGVLAPGVFKVRVSAAGRSPGLKPRELVRLLGVAAPRPGRCGHREALAETLTLGFGEEARDTDADGLVDRAPINPSKHGALVDIRTDVKVKPLRDARARLRAYLDAGHTGLDLGRALVASGWFLSGAGDLTRAQRQLNAESRAQESGKGAWVLCHADFDRPATERFEGFAPCPGSFNPDGSDFDGPGGFVRNVIVSGGDCDAAYAAISGWAPEVTLDGVDLDGDGHAEDSVTLPDGTSCAWEIYADDENPAVEVTCRTPAGATALAWAAP